MRRVVRSLLILPLLTTLLAFSLVSCGGGAEQPSVKTFKAANQGYSTDDLYRFFAVAFGAAPGVTYMGQLIEAAEWGLSIKEIVNIFTTKPQFTDTYPVSMSNADFATKLVENVVGASATSQAKQEAVNDIVSALSLPNWTRGDVIYAVFNNLAKKPESDTKWYGTAKKMANQVAYAKYYTESMLQNNTDLKILRRVIASVDEKSNTTGSLLDAISIFVDPIFSESPSFLPDLRAKYDKLCGSAANMQNAIPVDLNNDGRKDLLLPIWCFYQNGQDADSPAVNLLIALVQDEGGNFIDKTLEIFGTEYPSLIGKNQNWTIADFNNDGKPDIILGTDREDGRPIIGNGANMRAPAVALMSGSSNYSIVPFGIPRFGDNVISVRSSTNQLQLLVITADNQVEMWEYHNEWVRIENEFSIMKPIQKNPVFINPRNDNKLDSTNYLVNNVINSNCNSTGCIKDAYYFELWSKASGSWTKVDTVPTLTVKSVAAITPGPFGTWTPTKAYITTFEGVDYIDMGFIYDGCSLKMTPTSATIGLRSFLGDEIVGGYQGQTNLDANWRPPTLKIFTTEVVDNKLVIKPSIISEKLPSNYYRMKCGDYNNDGYDDIMIELGGGGALLFFNDKNGNFKRPKSGVIPSYNSEYFSFNVLFSDLNNDGILDILYYPLIGYSGSNGQQSGNTVDKLKIQLPLYKAYRDILVKDLKQ